MIEAVLARLQCAVLHHAHHIEGIAAADNSTRLQQPPHPLRGRARRNLHKCFQMRPGGRGKEPGASSQRQQEEEQQKATQEWSDPFAGQSKHSIDCSLHSQRLWLS